MMMRVGLAKTKFADDDELGRAGDLSWRDDLSPADLYTRARGCWRADFYKASHVTHVLVTYRGKVHGIFAVDSTHRTKSGARVYFEGTPLTERSAIYREWVGKDLGSQRYPIGYLQ